MARILIADDDQFLRGMVTFKLRNRGHEVVAAVDGGEALAAALAQRFDLIILDVMMPVLDGLEVLRRLKADENLTAIPVIMLTARGQERDVVGGLSAGAADYMVKPFSVNELNVRVDKALAGTSRAPA